MYQFMTLLAYILLMTPLFLHSAASSGFGYFVPEECDTDNAKNLGYAVSYLDQPYLTALLSAGINIHARITVEPRSITNPKIRVTRKWTALMIAANNDAPHTAGMLLDAGADPNAVDEDDETALTLAINKKWEALKIVHVLLGTDNTPSDLSASSGRPPRVPTKSDKPAKRRIKAHVNVITKNGETPLLRAVRLGHTNIVKALIKAGAYLTPTIAGKPRAALEAAEKNGDIDIIMTLSQALPELEC